MLSYVLPRQHCYEVGCLERERVQQEDDMQSSLPKLFQGVKKKTGKSFLHTICFY